MRDATGTQQNSLVTSIQEANPDDFWIWAIIITIVALACGYGIFYFVRRARIIQDTPTSKIRSAAQGYVELIGKINYLVNEPILAPLTSQACAWFQYEIEERRVRHTKNGTQTDWVTIDKKISERAFQCEDGTGICLVDPRGAEVHSTNRDIWYGSTKWPGSGPTGQTGLFSGGKFRYTEYRLHAGEPLYALGLFRTVDPNKAHGDINNETRAIIKVWKQDQATLLEKYDSNQDGEFDMNEWQAVRDAAEQKAYQQRLARADRPPVNMLGKTDDFRRPFILSVKPQTSMIKSFKLKAAACTAGFIIAGPLAIWLYIVRFMG